jgi:hypothetical protein
LWLWWYALHALLVATATLVAGPWWLGLAAIVVVVAHGIVRRPSASPALIIVAADARCTVPDRGLERCALGARTVVCPYWVKLAFGTSPRQRDVLLLADQIDVADWTRLRALLRRARCDAPHVPGTNLG